MAVRILLFIKKLEIIGLNSLDYTIEDLQLDENHTKDFILSILYIVFYMFF